MHTIIYAIVIGESRDEALGNAQITFDKLVGATEGGRKVFDYYTTFEVDEDEQSPVSGAGRWGNMPKAAPIDTEDGQEMLDNGWENTKQESDDALDQIREHLDNCTNEEIREGYRSDAEIELYDFSKVGERAGPSVRLYDNTGYTNGIISEALLEDTLEHARSEAKSMNGEYTVYIVPADVHF